MSIHFLLLFLLMRPSAPRIMGDEDHDPSTLGLVQPSEKFQSCHFNALCYCRYSTTTELHSTLLTLYHHSSFNATQFLKTIQKEYNIRKPLGQGQSPGHASSHTNVNHVHHRNGEVDVTRWVELILNNSSLKFDPGPVFEFFCVAVPLAVIPMDYTTQGTMSHVTVAGSELALLDGSAFAGMEIQNLQLNKNELYFISEYAFSSMSNSLTVLDLSANFLDEIPFAAFKTLKLLEWLNLSNNKIATLEGDWFGLMTSLRQLTLSDNSIATLPPKLFPNFHRLIWLDLSSNFIRNLSEHRLPTNLQTLIMMKNPMSVFPLGIFALRSLSWLVFSGCGIETVPADYPRGTAPSQINQLDLAQNLIQHWPKRPFSSQLKILDLDVSKNYITNLPSAAFQSMNAFRISLGHNRLQEIDPSAFDTLGPTLQYLNLDNNRLERMPWMELRNLTSLKHLYLGNNLIQDKSLEVDETGKMRGGEFDCSNLQYLGLNGNGLTRLPRRILSSCPSLIHLNLGYNQIGNLDELSSRKFKLLSTLILRNNPIHTLSYQEDNSIPPPPPALHPLSSIPNIFRPEHFPRLYELSLSFCDLSGELPPFPGLPLTNLEISGGLKSASAISAEALQNLRQLEWIALDHNQISNVSDYTFYSNKNITYVNLEFNRISVLPRQMFHPDIHYSIRELRLSHNKISKLGPDSFLSFPAANLDLSYNNIHTIDRHAFNIAPPTSQSTSTPSPQGGTLLPKSDGLNLYLRHNRITFIKNGAFSQERFALVDLSYNLLNHFNFDAFGRRATVEGVNISHNSLERINSHGGRRMLLNFLDASHNKLRYGGVKVHGVCPRDSFDLGWNRLEKVDGDLFPTNCSIKVVNLNQNQIATLDPDSFSQLRDLTVLDLGGNLISYVPEILLIRNHKLTYLDLSRNRIRSLPRDSLVGSNIEILILAGNEFVNLPVGALAQISRRLKILDMSSNSLEHLDSTMFESIPGLVALNLSSNRLSILPDNAFANLGSLRELDLSGNFLRANFKELFHFLPKLKLLRLSDCGIKSLPHLPLPHLSTLDLSHNGLSDISSQSLTSLTRLRSLDLRHNLLQNSRLPNWSPLLNLVELKVSNNPLKSLTRDTFFGLNRLESLEMLDLDRVDRFDSDVLSYLMNLKRLAVETYPNIEKYRFRLGAVLSAIESLEELHIQIQESTLSDQLFGGILPGLKKLTLSGANMRRIEDQAFEGLQNCLSMDLAIVGTGVEEIPSRLFELLLNAAWARLDLSGNKISSLDSSSLYPNSSFWYSKGTKLLQGGLSLTGNELQCDCNLVWLGDWLRRWLRESFESHSALISEVHGMYSLISETTCLDSRTGGNIPIVQLYPDHICHASALSAAATVSSRFSNFNFHTFSTGTGLLLIIIQGLGCYFLLLGS